MFKSIFINTTVVGLLMWAAGCNNYIKDYEISPNQPLTVEPNLLLSSAELALFSSYTNNLARITGVFIHQHTGTGRQMLNIDRWQITEIDTDSDWQQAYSSGLMDAKVLADVAKNKGFNHYYGIANILLGMQFGLLTDLWGDIPVREALQGKALPNPRYDQQKQVYRLVVGYIDAGLAALDLPAGARLPSTDDLIHKGNIQHWKITALSLKARFLNRYSRTSGYDPTATLAAVDAALSLGASKQSNAVASFSTTTNNQNPWYQFGSFWAGDMTVSKFLVDTLQNSGDPRLPFYATLDPARKQYLPADYLAGVSASIPLVTFTELKFIQAENYWLAGQKNLAAEAYNAAVASALELPGIDNTTDYKARVSRTAETLTEADLFFQKYLALYMQIEAYTDYRKTGIPQLKPKHGLPLTAFPNRLALPQSERLLNKNAPAPQPTTTKMTWQPA